MSRAARRATAALAVLLAALLAVAACAPRVQPPGPDARTPVLAGDRFVTHDGLPLPVRAWPAEGEARAVVVALHGFNDHSRAFEMPAESWSVAGILTYAYDQRGFGGSLYRGQWPGTGRLVGDLADFMAAVRARHPGLPLFVVGESMGGAVAIVAAARGRIDPAGLVLVAPAVWGRETMPLHYGAALWAGAHLLPWARVTGRGLDITPSDNVAMLRRLAADPRVIKETRIDAIYGLVGLMDTALDEAARLDGPALILYGHHDEIVPKEPTREMMTRLDGSAPVRVAVYPEGYHMLLRDLQAEVVHRDVAAWIADPAAPLPSGAEDGAEAWLADDGAAAD